jgi:hypothetical protein
LRIQHPEWIEPNGDCSTCESYESRLAQLLGFSQQRQHLDSSYLNDAAA